MRIIVALLLSVMTVSCGGGGTNSDSRDPPTPEITGIRAGDGLLSVSFFVAPTASNATLSAVSLITASCSSSPLDQISATGSASPLELTGLQNGVEYTCTVTAKAVSGVTRTSIAVKAIPNPRYSVVVVPGVNGTFTSGTTIEAYSVLTGKRLAIGTTDIDGRAAFEFSTVPTDLAVFIAKGSSASRFYSYSNNSLVAFGAGESLYTLVPVSSIVSTGTTVSVNPITTAIANAAGFDFSAFTAGRALSVTASTLQAAIVKISLSLGINPNTFSVIGLPALPRTSDQSKAVLLTGSDVELFYGLVLVAISSLKGPNEDLIVFIKSFSQALSTGTLQNLFQNFALTFPASYNAAKINLLESSRQSTFALTVAPGAARYDYAILDRDRYE